MAITYGLTDAGFVLKPFSVIRSEIEEYQLEYVDEGLDLSDDTALAQINVSHALQIAEVWELAAAVYSNQYPDTATGSSLVNVASLTGTTPNEYSATRVLGQVTLNPNTTLPVGSVANLTDRPNSRFATVTEVPADPGGGTFDVWFESEELGAIDVLAGQLSEIAEPVTGWTAVTNAEAGLPGSEPETDDELRIKREREIETSGAGNKEAIRADVSQVEGVIDVSVEENVKEYYVGDLPPKSIRVTVRGGAEEDIAQAIFDSKSAGIDTVGNVSVDVIDSEGITQTIRYRDGAPVNFYCEVEVEWISGEQSDAVKENIAAYVNSLGLGDDVKYDLVLCAVYKDGLV